MEAEKDAIKPGPELTDALKLLIALTAAPYSIDSSSSSSSAATAANESFIHSCAAPFMWSRTARRHFDLLFITVWIFYEHPVLWHW